MRRQVIHFSHANGFPAACYRKLFGYLRQDFEVGYVDAIGHDPAYPVTDGWPHLVRQLIDCVSARYPDPVIGVGHSLGGFLSFLAAIQRPELFSAIVVMDAPVVGYFKSKALEISKRIGMVDRVTPGRGTRRRRSEWPSLEAARAHFRQREPYRRFDPDCLSDYVFYGTEPAASGVRLRFDPQVEYQIYRTIPHDLYRYRNRLMVPAGFMVGRESNVVGRIDLGYMKRAFNMHFARVDGGHLFPFEHPREAADKLGGLIARLIR